MVLVKRLFKLKNMYNEFIEFDFRKIIIYSF